MNLNPDNSQNEDLDDEFEQFVDEMLKEQEPNSLVSEDQMREKLRSEVRDMLKFEKETEAVSHSMAILTTTGVELHGKNRVDEIMAELRQVGDKLVESADEIAKTPENTAELVGITEPILIDILKVALDAYSHEQWESAESVYRFLTILNPANAEMWMCLGSTLQNQRKFEEARQNYVRASELDKVDPHYPLYIAECYLLEGDLQLSEQWEQVGRQRIDKNEVEEGVIEMFNDFSEARVLAAT